jgi:hypothetical protein
MPEIINITQQGSFDNTEKYLNRLKSIELYSILDKYGSLGVAALSNATPRDTGLTAASWFYTIEKQPGYYSIRWHNSHEVNGTPIAVMLQYGHGTGTGGYVPGRDFIMSSIKPIFEQIAADAQREVSKL